jgi:glycerophosphoryl diester phosphodiesterase
VSGRNQPLLVSHRGNYAGPTGTGRQNRRETIEGAIAAGFEWVEIDIRTTKDGTAVLMHDPVVTVEGKEKKIYEIELGELREIPAYRNVLTLNEVMEDYADRVNLLIEAKWSDYLPANMHLAREIARFARNARGAKRLIIDSFDEYIALSIKQYCRCEVGLDAPFRSPVSKEYINYLSKSGFDWIYVHHSVVDRNLLENAHHAGIKVMAYTVNDEDVIKNWFNKGMPDGIITDTAGIASLVKKQRNQKVTGE